MPLIISHYVHIHLLREKGSHLKSEFKTYLYKQDFVTSQLVWKPIMIQNAVYVNTYQHHVRQIIIQSRVFLCVLKHVWRGSLICAAHLVF